MELVELRPVGAKVRRILTGCGHESHRDRHLRTFDDEDVTPDLEMGQAVIERLLGGRILDDDGSRGER